VDESEASSLFAHAGCFVGHPDIDPRFEWLIVQQVEEVVQAK